MSKLNLLCALLSLCPCFALAQSSPTPGGEAGIEGRITMSPIHGGPVREGARESAPLAHVNFQVKQGDKIISSFTTDDAGHFRVLVPAGHYSIVRKDRTAAIGAFGPFEVEVSAGKMASVNWQCDSGLR